MKYGVISDVHANYPALSAALSDMPDEIDGVIFLGDLVGLMGFPGETVEKIIDVSTYAIKGNHDISVLEHNTGHVNSQKLSDFELRTTKEDFSEEQIEWVTSLSAYREIPSEGLLLAHAKPYPDMATGLEPRNPGVKKGSYTSVASNIDDDRFDFVLLGHTHTPAVLDCSKFGNDVIVLNPGSVGQPAGAANYAIIDTENTTATLSSIDYEAESVYSRIVERGVPFKWWE